MSIISASTSPTIGQNVQCPPNQLCTAEYQSSVVGRKMNPTIGHRMLSNTQRNQCVKNHINATTSRGAARASRVIIHGIGQAPSRDLRFEVETELPNDSGSPAWTRATFDSSLRRVSPALIVRADASSRAAHITSGGSAMRRASAVREMEPVQVVVPC